MREIIEHPGNRQLDQINRVAELIRSVEIDDIPRPAPVGLEVAAHQRAFVREAIFKQKIDRNRTIVPRWRPVAGGSNLSDLFKCFESALQHPAFFCWSQTHRILMEIPMMSDLMTRRGDGADMIGIGFNRVAGNEKSCRKLFAVKQAENALNANRAEFAPRDHAG